MFKNFYHYISTMGSACYKLLKKKDEDDAEKRKLLLADSLLHSSIYDPIPEYVEPDTISNHSIPKVTTERIMGSIKCSRYMDVVDDCNCEFCQTLCPRCAFPLERCRCEMNYST